MKQERTGRITISVSLYPDTLASLDWLCERHTTPIAGTPTRSEVVRYLIDQANQERRSGDAAR